MPPSRTIPVAKMVKTERTHEENQERAYIAASRRSDRSLEARIESARRASEIHRRRTGRSLRVTEQDVINEEMYEEEDDDLPLHYRRLTAHLQTNSVDFNRRLTAYLSNQVAMRSAMDQMAQNPYMQQTPGMTSPYPQQRPNMFQSPMMQQHSVAQSPSQAYRPAPYPSPHHPGYRNGHGRAYSAAMVPSTAQTPPTPHSLSMDHRRMSTPSVIHPPGAPVIKTEDLKPDMEYLRQTQSAQVPSGQYPPLWQDMGPFTTSLPPESQLMLAGAPALDPNDPFSAALMRGSEAIMANPYYPWGNFRQDAKGMPGYGATYPGMSATLAPSALDTQHESLSATPSTIAPPTIDNGAPTSGLDLSQEDGHGYDLQKPLKRSGSMHDLPSGAGTPGESFWNSFVHDGGWSEDNAS